VTGGRVGADDGFEVVVGGVLVGGVVTLSGLGNMIGKVTSPQEVFDNMASGTAVLVDTNVNTVDAKLDHQKGSVTADPIGY
jgi:pantothenate kinase